jgi:hypothetical protein
MNDQGVKMPDLFQPFQPCSNLKRVGWNAANASIAGLSSTCSNRSNLFHPRVGENAGGIIFSYTRGRIGWNTGTKVVLLTKIKGLSCSNLTIKGWNKVGTVGTL